MKIIPQDINPFPFNSLTIELIGKIHSKNNDYLSEFMHITNELDSQNNFIENTNYDFSFYKPGFSLESYNGENLFIEYSIIVTITKQYIQTKTKVEQKFIVICPIPRPKGLCAQLSSIIGFQTQLQDLKVEFILNKNKYHVKECMIGSLCFLQVKNVVIHSIEMHVIRNEKVNNKSENYLLGKYELCDGQPFTNEIIPIQMYLYHVDTTPSIVNINNFSSWVKYYIKIVIRCNDIEEDNGQLYTMQEIVIWREEENEFN